MADDKQKLEERFWEELEDSPFVMLGLQGVDDDFTRPMTAQLDERTILFLCRPVGRSVQGPAAQRPSDRHLRQQGPQDIRLDPRQT